jgi:hypothetical protein
MPQTGGKMKWLGTLLISLCAFSVRAETVTSIRWALSPATYALVLAVSVMAIRAFRSR